MRINPFDPCPTTPEPAARRVEPSEAVLAGDAAILRAALRDSPPDVRAAAERLIRRALAAARGV
jgi:hypothetical protein